MKKFLLLFASVVSLALAVPSGTYAAVSVSDLSDADQGKTVDVTGVFIDVSMVGDSCGGGIGLGNNRAWREQAQYSQYDSLIGKYGCSSSPFAIISSDATLARKQTDKNVDIYVRRDSYVKESGYEVADVITKTSSGDLLVYASKDLGKNIEATPQYQEWQAANPYGVWRQYLNLIVPDLSLVEMRGTYVHVKGVFPYEHPMETDNKQLVDTDMRILIVDSIKIASISERIPFKDGDTTAYIRSITKSPELLAQYDAIDRKLANIEKAKSATLPNLLGWMDALAKAKKVCVDRVKSRPETYENWIPYVVAKTNEFTKSASATIDAKYLRLAGPNATTLAKTDSLSTALSSLSSSDIRTAYPDLTAIFDRSDKKIMAEIARGMDEALYQKYLDDASDAGLSTLFTETKWEVIQSMYESRLKAEAARGYESSR
ncbi:MAG TPA: hypothetical protein PK765_07865 [bacterium]|nr:hypothetical protein [bacterium]